MTPPIRTATPVAFAAAMLAGCGTAAPGTATGGAAGQVSTPSATAAPTPSPTPPWDPSVAKSTALAKVATLGYTGQASADGWGTPTQVGVIVGYQPQGDGHNERAFFFSGGRYLGTDTSQPSAGIQLTGDDGTIVTLTYSVYAAGAPLCCPTSLQPVRFEWNGTTLHPIDPIPPYSERY